MQRSASLTLSIVTKAKPRDSRVRGSITRKQDATCGQSNQSNQLKTKQINEEGRRNRVLDIWLYHLAFLGEMSFEILVSDSCGQASHIESGTRVFNFRPPVHQKALETTNDNADRDGEKKARAANLPRFLDGDIGLGKDLDLDLDLALGTDLDLDLDLERDRSFRGEGDRESLFQKPGKKKYYRTCVLLSVQNLSKDMLL